MFSILIVEDDVNTRRLLETVFSSEGYKVTSAGDGFEALEKLHEKHIDLIVLDLMMPKMDGCTFTRKLRKSNNNIPILMATAKETANDKKEGFIAGTDDYMVKPIDEEEMLLRVKALLRRSRIASEHKLAVGRTELNYDNLTVAENGIVNELPQKEFLLLYKLLSYDNQIFTRQSLMDELWEMNSDTEIRTVDVHINRLRDRFRTNTDFEIVTVRGLGYKAVRKDEKN